MNTCRWPYANNKLLRVDKFVFENSLENAAAELACRAGKSNRHIFESGYNCLLKRQHACVVLFIIEIDY